MSLVLRGIDYGPVLNSAGARGFAGEGYWWHRFVPGLDYSGSTFVAKTVTYHDWAGNMPLDERMRPRSLKPDCIRVYFDQGMVLNAVGLSNPGIHAVLPHWQRVRPPWMLSVFPMSISRRGRCEEIEDIGKVLSRELLPRPFAIQLNLSCPNTPHDHADMVNEAVDLVHLLRPAHAPVLLKLNALFDPGLAPRLPGDGVVCSNSIPFGATASWLIPKSVEQEFQVLWKTHFPSGVSPLAHLGGGGLSGAPIFHLSSYWVKMARRAGYDRPIVGGGGILGPRDTETMFEWGADAVELGSISILRPWRVRKTIAAARRHR